MTTEEYGPYVGFGYGNALLPGSRVRVLLDIGAYYHGEPVVSLVATPNPGVPLPPGFQANLEAEEASVQEEIKDYKIYPVISLGVSIRF